MDPTVRAPVLEAEVGYEATKNKFEEFKPSEIVISIVLYGYTVTLSNFDRL